MPIQTAVENNKICRIKARSHPNPPSVADLNAVIWFTLQPTRHVGAICASKYLQSRNAK
jgi:hypothetical protein